jgi:hypothetical protein
LNRLRPFGLGYYPVECVLTETGFFHCFKVSKAKHKELLQKTKLREIARNFNPNNTLNERGGMNDEEVCFNEVDSKPEFR